MQKPQVSDEIIYSSGPDGAVPDTEKRPLRARTRLRSSAVAAVAFTLLFPLTASADLSDLLNKASQALGAVGQGLDAVNTLHSGGNRSGSSSSEASSSGAQASGYQTINGTRVFTQVDIANHQATFSNECGSQTLTQAELQGGAIPSDIIPCPRPAQANPAMPGDTAAWQHRCEELEQAQNDLAISCWSGLADSSAARNDPELTAMAKAHADRLAAMSLAKAAPGCPYGDLASGLGGALCLTDKLTQAQCESPAIGGMWTAPVPGRPSTGKCSYMPVAQQEAPRESLRAIVMRTLRRGPASKDPEADPARSSAPNDIPVLAELAGMEAPGSESRGRIVGSIKSQVPAASTCIDGYVARLDDLRWSGWKEPFAQGEARIEQEHQDAQARREASRHALPAGDNDVCRLLAERGSAQRAAVRWVRASNGEIPPGALIGGHEASGQALAICRGRYINGVHPGKVVGSACSIGWGGREIMLRDFEVAVGSVSWVAASNGNVPSGAVIGGTSVGPELQLPLCRVAYRGGVHPGKFVVDKCNFSWGGAEITSSVYEVGIGTSLEWVGSTAH